MIKCSRCAQQATAQAVITLASGTDLPAFPLCEEHEVTEIASMARRQVAGTKMRVRTFPLPVQAEIPYKSMSHSNPRLAEASRQQVVLSMYRANRERGLRPMEALDAVERALSDLAMNMLIRRDVDVAKSLAGQVAYLRLDLRPVAKSWADADAALDRLVFEGEARRVFAWLDEHKIAAS